MRCFAYPILSVACACHAIGDLDGYDFNGVGQAGGSTTTTTANSGGGDGAGGSVVSTCGNSNLDSGELCFGAKLVEKNAGVGDPIDLAAIYCNDDELPDIAVLDGQADARFRMAVLPGSRRSGLEMAMPSVQNTTQQAVAFAFGPFFDENGVDLAIVYVRPLHDFVEMYTGNDMCQFDAPTRKVFTTTLSDLAALSLDGDNFTDLVGTEALFPALTTVTTEPLQATHILAPEMAQDLTAIATSDLDGDGDDDAVFIGAEASAPKIYVALQIPNVDFQISDSGVEFEGAPVALALGDVDGDLDIDVVTADKAENRIIVLRNDGEGLLEVGSWASTVSGSENLGKAPIDVSLGDVDRDGDLDVLVANEVYASLVLLLNDGNGNFTVATPMPPNGEGQFPVVADAQLVAAQLVDVNGDGALDIVYLTKASMVGLLLATP